MRTSLRVTFYLVVAAVLSAQSLFIWRQRMHIDALFLDHATLSFEHVELTRRAEELARELEEQTNDSRTCNGRTTATLGR